MAYGMIFEGRLPCARGLRVDVSAQRSYLTFGTLLFQNSVEDGRNDSSFSVAFLRIGFACRVGAGSSSECTEYPHSVYQSHAASAFFSHLTKPGADVENHAP